MSWLKFTLGDTEQLMKDLHWKIPQYILAPYNLYAKYFGRIIIYVRAFELKNIVYKVVIKMQKFVL